ncbi:MAG: energy transducer TonB [Verrucomicrobiota bacterium]
MVLANYQANLLHLTSSPIVRALGISLAFHLALFGTIELGSRMGLWKRGLWPSWVLAAVQRKSLSQSAEQKKKQAQRREVPLLFVDVDPAQASLEPPQQSKYYSALNTRAANPDIRMDSNVPKIDGAQTKVPQTREVPRSKAQPLQPALPVEKPPDPEPPQPEIKPKSGPAPGELAFAKPSPRPKDDQGDGEADSQHQTPPERPRTLAAARRKMGLPPGEKMKQEGGVKRFSLDSNLDVTATPFGSYDAAFIAAVRARWFSLLDERDFVRNYSGKVVLEFRLNHDGRITNIQVDENEVSETLSWICQRAVQDPAPFAPFPNDLRRMLGEDYREVRFTFHYN